MRHKTPKKLLEGGKFASSNSTIIPDAIGVIGSAKSLVCVTKIVLGVINQVRPGQPRLKFTVIPAGLRLQIRGVNRVQKFFIYTSRSGEVEEKLRGVWEISGK